MQLSDHVLSKQGAHASLSSLLMGCGLGLSHVCAGKVAAGWEDSGMGGARASGTTKPHTNPGVPNRSVRKLNPSPLLQQPSLCPK